MDVLLQFVQLVLSARRFQRQPVVLGLQPLHPLAQIALVVLQLYLLAFQLGQFFFAGLDAARQLLKLAVKLAARGRQLVLPGQQRFALVGQRFGAGLLVFNLRRQLALGGLAALQQQQLPGPPVAHSLHGSTGLVVIGPQLVDGQSQGFLGQLARGGFGLRQLLFGLGNLLPGGLLLLVNNGQFGFGFTPQPLLPLAGVGCLLQRPVHFVGHRLRLAPLLRFLLGLLAKLLSLLAQRRGLVVGSGQVGRYGILLPRQLLKLTGQFAPFALAGQKRAFLSRFTAGPPTGHRPAGAHQFAIQSDNLKPAIHRFKSAAGAGQIFGHHGAIERVLHHRPQPRLSHRYQLRGQPQHAGRVWYASRAAGAQRVQRQKGGAAAAAGFEVIDGGFGGGKIFHHYILHATAQRGFQRHFQFRRSLNELAHCADDAGQTGFRLQHGPHPGEVTGHIAAQFVEQILASFERPGLPFKTGQIGFELFGGLIEG